MSQRNFHPQLTDLNRLCKWRVGGLVGRPLQEHLRPAAVMAMHKNTKR